MISGFTPKGNAVNDSGAAISGISGLKGRFCQPRPESAQPTEAWVRPNGGNLRPEGPVHERLRRIGPSGRNLRFDAITQASVGCADSDLG